jgi:RimJ/RimL family protein N-acetyltransferase
MENKIEIETPRLILREIRETDVAGIMQANDWEILKWMELVNYPYTESDAKDWIKFCIEESEKDRDFRKVYVAGMELKENKDFLGEISLNEVDIFRNKGEVSYWLGKGHQGKGYMTEAMKGFKDFSFGKLYLSALEASTFLKNVPSEKLLEKSGFHITNTDDKLKYWSLPIEDYIKQKSP